MRLREVRIRNFKSFMDSGPMEFAPGMNVVVGQNNAGKSAFLEVLSARFESNPHRSVKSKPKPVSRLDPGSRIEFALEFGGAELRDVLLALTGAFRIPLPAGDRADPEHASRRLEAILAADSIVMNLVYQTAGGVPPIYPDSDDYLGYPNQGVYGQFTVDESRTRFFVHGIGGRDVNEDLGTRCGGYFREHVYVFRAERFNVGQHTFGTRTELLPDASNLPEVLNALQGNHLRFERFNRRVTEIFPTIKRVSVLPRAENTKLEVVVWTTDPALEREDLAIPLVDCGTGVAQVLAILYVTITSPTARPIIIDEPNSFLHPGAARKLIEILRQYPEQQFIIATHSAEVIRAAKPQQVAILRWNDGQTELEQLDVARVESMAALLREVGATLGDVFGADRVVWVEGPTEAECFPLILDRLLGMPTVGTAIVPMRDTGSFESKRANAQAIWRIYQRLTQGAALLPPTLAFSFDREGRSDKEIEDLRRESRERVKFLPRRLYENYLLERDAIVALLGTLPAFKGQPPTEETVAQWLEKNHAGYLPPDQTNAALGSADWLVHIDGARLLCGLVQDLSGGREEYRKTMHSVWLTDWLIQNKPKALQELGDYVRSLAAA